MITYEYEAKNQKTGELLHAEISAESEQSAARALIARGLFPVTITEKKKKGFDISFGTGVPNKDRAVFTRQLATLINAGLPLAQSLHTVKAQVTNKNLIDILSHITEDVEGGSTLHDAFAKYPKVFNAIYLSMLAAGETSGTLDKTLERLASQQEKDAAIRSKVIGAMVYPVIALLIILSVITFMFVVVVPQIAHLFRDLHKTLPIATQITIGISDFILHFWYVLLAALFALALSLRAYISTEYGRMLVDRKKLSVPVFGPILHKLYMARYCRTCSTLVGTGVPVLKALEVVKNSINNVYVEEGIEKSIGDVRSGKSLSSSITNDDRFLVLVPQMVKIGEESGSLDEMLGRTANFYESEVDDAVANLSATIEPVLIVVLGIIVASMIFIVLWPVYSLVINGVQ